MHNHQFITYPIFKPFPNLLAFTTTKTTVDIQNPRFTGDIKTPVIHARKQLAQALEIKQSQLVFPRQTHTSCVASVSEIPRSEISETDALVSSEKNICLCIQTADCVPILLFDPVKQVIAAVHAGWRGTTALIAAAAVDKMHATHQSQPSDIVALIGPSIGPESYEVGDEVIDAVHANIPNAGSSIIRKPSGRFHLDLWEANRQVLISSGIKLQNVGISYECTFILHGKYYSARREGAETGRIVSGIMMH